MIIRKSRPIHSDLRDHFGELRYQDHALIGVEEYNDVVVFTHTQDVEGAMEEAHISRKYSDNGFTSSRSMRHVGSIPTLIWEQHPEWTKRPELAKKWLKTEEGRPFRACTGRF